MRIEKIEKEIYKYSELSEEAKEKAISDRIKLWINIIPVDEVSHNSNYYKAYKEAERMKTPWFFQSYIFDFCKNQIIKELKQDEFDIDGNIV